MLSAEKRKFLNDLIREAVQLEAFTKIPAEVVVGQGVWESAWGQSALAKQGNNLFGVKAQAGYQDETIVLRGFEYENGKRVDQMIRWRKYPSIEASILDHAHFLSKPRYAKAFRTTTYKAFLTEIRKAGYATDPNYVKGILRVLNGNGIPQSIADERAALLAKDKPELMRVALPQSTFLQRLLSMLK